MPLVQLDVWGAHDLNGTSIGTVTSDEDFFEAFKLSPRLRSLGGASLALSRDLRESLDTGIMGPEAFVRVLIPSIHATKYLWGFFINQREQTMVSRNERAGEHFVISGMGPKFYLDRTTVWDEKFGPSGTGFRVDAVNGVVTFADNATVGDVLVQLLAEDDAQTIVPTKFLPDLTFGFDDFDDSNGSPWTSNYQLGADFELEIGKSYLDHLWTIQESCRDDHPVEFEMDLGSVGSPLMRLDAYKNYGRDLTGTAFGAGVVLLREAFNIEGELRREGVGRAPRKQASGTALRKATHALVRGKDGAWGRAEKSSYSPGAYAKAVLVDYQNSANEDVLNRAGLRWLRHQQDADNEFELTITPGFDEAAGHYMAGMAGTDGHVWLGDMVTLKTGGTVSSALEYEFAPQHVTGIDLVLRDAAKDDTDQSAARSFDLTLLLNVDRGSDNRLPDGGGGSGDHAHPPNPKLCSALTPGTETVLRWYPAVTISAVQPAQDAAWDIDAIGTGDVQVMTTTPSDTRDGQVFNTTTQDAGDDIAIAAFAVEMDAGLAAIVAAGGAVIRGQFRTRMRSGIGISEAAQDGIAQMEVSVTEGETNTIRGVAKAMHDLASSAGSVKFTTSSTPRNAMYPPAADTNVLSAVAGTSAGDYLVATVGYRNFTPDASATGGGMWFNDRPEPDDLPEDESTSTNLRSWIELRATSAPSGSGHHPDLVGDEEECYAGCEHTHHILSNRAPTTADDITQGYPETTLWTNTETSQTYLLIDEDAGTWMLVGTAGEHSHEIEDVEGLEDALADETAVIVDHGAMGATEDFDVAAGADHEGVIDENLTVTLSGAADGERSWLTLRLTDDGDGPYTLTWPASVSWPGGVEPEPPAASEALIVTLFSDDGGINWYGSYPGTAGSALTVEDDDGATTVTDVEQIQFEADHFLVTDEGSGVAKVSLVEGAGGSGGVLPLTAVVDDVPMLVWDEENSLIPVEV